MNPITNPVMENLLTRRSVRAFLDKPIPREELDAIVKAALYAPSGMGRQTWQFIVVTDRAKIQALAAAVEQELGRAGYNMYEPEAIIIPSNEKTSPYGMEDNACALENIFLAAWSLGVGSVWINQLRDICDTPSVRSLLTAWGVPEDHTVYGIAALGYPAGPAKKDVAKTGTVVFAD